MRRAQTRKSQALLQAEVSVSGALPVFMRKCSFFSVLREQHEGSACKEDSLCLDLMPRQGPCYVLFDFFSLDLAASFIEMINILDKFYIEKFSI